MTAPAVIKGMKPLPRQRQLPGKKLVVS